METGKPVLYLKKYKVALNYTGSNLILGTFLIPWRQFLPFPHRNLQLDLHPNHYKELLRWLSGKKPTCQCSRLVFDPWVRKIPCRREWQSNPVIVLGESHGQRSLVGYSPGGHEKLDTTERLSMHTCNHDKTPRQSLFITTSSPLHILGKSALLSQRPQLRM